MELQNTDVNQPLIGMSSNKPPVDQQKGTYPMALNTVNQEGALSNEKGNTPCAELSTNYIPLGNAYTNDSRNIVLSVSANEKFSEIGIIDKNCVYTPVVDLADLGFRLNHQISVTYRLRRGCEDVIYFTDNLNQVRVFNFSKPSDFYSQLYKDHLKSGTSIPFTGQKWDILKFNLFPAYKVPCISDMKVIVGGTLRSGTYNFAIQYLDSNQNPTNFIYTSQLVSIIAQSLDANYNDILGSSNFDVDALAGTGDTDKAIKLTFSGLDTTYVAYRVAVVAATSKTGEVSEVLLSPSIPINRNEYTYDGNIQGYTKITELELKLSKADIEVSDHIEQIENRLILANVKGKQVQYCEFQKFASKISSQYVVREAKAGDVYDSGNPKSPHTYWEQQGYMGGDVYPFGIVYVFKDGLESPVFHIPGRPAGKYLNLDTDQVVTTNDQEIINTWNYDLVHLAANQAAYNALPQTKKIRRWQVYDTAVKYSPNGTNNSYGAMAYFANKDIFYEPKGDCSDNDFWGVDCTGTSLVGKPVRHHKFPSRTLEPHTRDGSIFSGSTGLYLDVSLLENQTFPTTPVNITINYEIDGVPGSKVINVATEDELPISAQEVAVSPNDMNSINIISTTGTIVDSTTVFSFLVYKRETNSSFVDSGIVRNFGIQFNNIEYPHPDIVGHYFVRGNRDESNRLVLDKGFAGQMRAKNIGPLQYTAFAYFGGDVNLWTDDNWLFTPRIQFNKENLNGQYLKYEGDYYDPSSSNYVGSREEDGVGSKFKEINNIIEWRVRAFYGFDTTRGGSNYGIYNSTSLDALAKNTTYNGVQGPMYNLSWTNRLNVVSTNSMLPRLSNNIAYVGVQVDRNVHPILDDIEYQRTHNCMLTVTNANVVFGGDIFISRWEITNSLYRRRKKGILKALINIILIAAAVVATVVTAGTAGAALAPAISAVIAGASAAGIASAIAVTALIAGTIGVTAQAIQTIQDEIENGALKQLTDDRQFNDATGGGIRLSSYMAYANELLTGLYVESEVNVALQQNEKHICGETFRYQTGTYEWFRAVWLYYDPDTEKWTPKGFACPVTYNYNKDFSRENEQSTYFALSSTYDCCSDCKESHPNRVMWSETAFQEELTDNYRVFKPNNYRDIEAEHGGITNIVKRNNNLYIQTSEGLWRLPQASQERITNEIVSFIGTGDFFSINPQKIIDAEIGAAGTQHKWATINVVEGLLIVNEIESKIYLYNDGFSVISDIEISTWFKDNLKDTFAKQYALMTDKVFPNQNNPANPFGVGIHSTYDADNDRLLITKRDFQLLPEWISQFEVVTSVNNQMPVGPGKFVFDTTTNKFVLLGDTSGIYDFIDFNNSTYFENKSWTISFSLDKKYKSWTSYHSYLPNYYIYTHNDLYSFIANSNKIWKHNVEGIYSNFYGLQYPHIIEQVFLEDRVTTMMWNEVVLQTTARKYDFATKQMVEQRNITFNKLVAYNERQSTGELTIVPKNEMGDFDFMSDQVIPELGSIIASRGEKDWTINDFLDYVQDPTKALFTRSWPQMKQNYFIDKVVNQSNINLNKDWNDVEVLRDKYLIVRLKFDNFTDVQLITHFILDTKTPSF